MRPHLATRILGACALASAAWLAAGCAVVDVVRAKDPVRLDVEQRYELAREHFRAQRWKQAETEFAAVYKADPEGPLASDASFYQAEARYGRGKYDGAFERYKRYVTAYPYSQHAPTIQKRLYDIGTFTLDGGRGSVLGVFSTEDSGIDVLDYLVSAFPNGDLADDALMRMARFEIENRQPLSAITRLHDLVDYYPGSEWALRARLDLARAYRSVNRGTSYDADALRRSAAQYRTYIEIVTANPEREADHAADLAMARLELAEVEGALADKLLESADYYLRTGKTEAGRAQLLNLVRDYPDSDAAGQAQARLGGLTGGGDAN